MITNQFRIQFVDTDLTQRIHYSSIFRYFERLDHDFFRKIGYSYHDLFEQGFEMPRVHVECNYLGEIQYDDLLEAQVTVAKIGNSSFTYLFQFMKEGQIVIKGTMSIVFISRSTGKKVPIPDFIKSQLEKHLEPAVLKN
ncbi:thioesterase family protein [Bacillus sp. B15-48]|uniref:acyl-CoA thioesterase n=1 Tax=Bacillus sp. B15-48 TaxID=1548601 RepID=UPI00193F80E0|nr:thioesterase family protein [Bacillus sp. B15-48]MBM4764995.1 hypothetical protein [Bacillus sp. B15-48]